MFSRLPSSCRYWADQRRQENATFQLLPFPSVYTTTEYTSLHFVFKRATELICKFAKFRSQPAMQRSRTLATLPKLGKQHLFGLPANDGPILNSGRLDVHDCCISFERDDLGLHVIKEIEDKPPRVRGRGRPLRSFNDLSQL